MTAYAIMLAHTASVSPSALKRETPQPVIVPSFVIYAYPVYATVANWRSAIPELFDRTEA